MPSENVANVRIVGIIENLKSNQRQIRNTPSSNKKKKKTYAKIVGSQKILISR